MPRARDGLGLIAAFRRSLLVNALNPKALTTWIAILAIFPVARATAGDIALLCAGACALSFLIHSGYALIFSSPRAMRFYLRWSWAVSGATGLFFLGFAGKIALGALASSGLSARCRGRFGPTGMRHLRPTVVLATHCTLDGGVIGG